jgi:hypothetical protein
MWRISFGRGSRLTKLSCVRSRPERASEMQMHVPPINPEVINELAEKATRDHAEVVAMRKKTTWLARMGEQLLQENHLSDRVRRILGD